MIGDPYVGQQYGEIWGYKVDGLFRNHKEAAEYASRIELSTVASGYYTATGAYGKGVRGGDIKYLDLNGDNIVNGGKGTLDDPGDRRVIGNSSPRYQYGASLNFSWYGFDVSVFMQGIGRLDWYPGADNLRFWGPYCRPYATFVPKNFMSQVWSEENPDAYFPAVYKRQEIQCQFKRLAVMGDDEYRGFYIEVSRPTPEEWGDAGELIASGEYDGREAFLADWLAFNPLETRWFHIASI